jgi:hypothetical protein
VSFFLLLGTDTILQEENSFKDSSLEDLQCMSATEITSKYLKISIQGTEDNCLLKPELDIKRNKVFNVMMSNFQSRPTIIVLQAVSLQMSLPSKQPCKITK